MRSDRSRVYEYVLDKEGRLFIDGAEVVHPSVLRLCFKGLEEASDGRLFFRCAGEINYVRAEDAPYVVRSVEVRADAKGRIEGVRLHLGGDLAEDLDPRTLEVGAENVLYARVRGGRFRARFARAAYYQLAEHIDARGAGYVIRVGGATHRIKASSM